MTSTVYSATEGWYLLLRTLRDGNFHEARGMKTWERLDQHVTIDMRHPVVRCPPRKLSYRFMAAEAKWILSGDNRVAPLAKHAPSIARFSDDGERLTGAYGPRFRKHVDAVADALVRDDGTRQAVCPVWSDETERRSKDVPCTVYLNFAIRGPWLHAFVRMRSSDAWLGFPYDVFSFTCMATHVAWSYNAIKFAYNNSSHQPVMPGRLYWSADSSHLYQRNVDGADEALDWASSHDSWHELYGEPEFDAAGFVGPRGCGRLTRALTEMELTGDPAPLAPKNGASGPSAS